MGYVIPKMKRFNLERLSFISPESIMTSNKSVHLFQVSHASSSRQPVPVARMSIEIKFARLRRAILFAIHHSVQCTLWIHMDFSDTMLSVLQIPELQNGAKGVYSVIQVTPYLLSKRRRK